MADKEGHSRLTQGMDAVVTAKAEDDAHATTERIVHNDRGVHNGTMAESV